MHTHTHTHIQTFYISDAIRLGRTLNNYHDVPGYPQKDEVIQSLVLRLYYDNKKERYDAVEKVYNINLQQCKPKDDL